MEGREGKIEFPCYWEYKIISTDIKEMELCVFELLDREYELEKSKKSSSGKYVSMNLKTKVISKEDRDRIFCDLKKCKSVKYII